jgi:hypothetical protein
VLFKQLRHDTFMKGGNDFVEKIIELQPIHLAEPGNGSLRGLQCAVNVGHFFHKLGSLLSVHDARPALVASYVFE